MKKLLFLFMLPMYASEKVQKIPKHLRRADAQEVADITQYQKAFAATQLPPSLLELVVKYLHPETVFVEEPIDPEDTPYGFAGNWPVHTKAVNKKNPDYSNAMSAALNEKDKEGHPLVCPLTEYDVQRGKGIPECVVQ